LGKAVSDCKKQLTKMAKQQERMATAKRAEAALAIQKRMAMLQIPFHAKQAEVAAELARTQAARAELAAQLTAAENARDALASSRGGVASGVAEACQAVVAAFEARVLYRPLHVDCVPKLRWRWAVEAITSGRALLSKLSLRHSRRLWKVPTIDI
jgi:hypothetical protein